MTNRRERALRASFALAGALTLGACGSARYPTHYVLNFEPSPQATAPRGSIGTLAVRDLRCPDYLCESRIVLATLRRSRLAGPTPSLDARRLFLPEGVGVETDVRPSCACAPSIRSRLKPARCAGWRTT